MSADPTPRRRLVGVSALSLAHLTNDSYAYLLPALLPLLLGKLGLTLGLAGLLVTIYQASSSFTQPVLGHLADGHRDTRWMAWSGVALSGLAAGAIGLAPSFEALALVLLAGGVGTALFHPISAALVAQAAPAATRGRWMSIYISSGNFGLPVGPLMLGIVLATLGLEVTWVVAAPALAVAALVWRAAPRRTTPVGHIPLPLRAVVRANARLLAGLVSVAGTRAWAATVTGSLLPLYAVSRGASVEDSARLLTGYLLAGAIGGLAGGSLADRVGRDRVIIASLTSAVPCLLALAVQTAVGAPFIVAAVGTGLFLNGSFVVLTVRGQESMPKSMGMISGVMNGLSIGLGGLAVAPMAVLAERTGIPTVLTISAALALLCAYLVTRLPRLPQGGPVHATEAIAVGAE